MLVHEAAYMGGILHAVEGLVGAYIEISLFQCLELNVYMCIWMLCRLSQNYQISPQLTFQIII